MSNPFENALANTQEDEQAEYYLTLSSGGATAFLAGLGANLGCWTAGLKKFRMLGGVSAGAIISSLIASGFDAVELLHVGLKTDFDKYVGLGPEILNLVRGFFGLEPAESLGPDLEHCRNTGLLSSHGVGKCLEQYSSRKLGSLKSWPDTFWTMATTRAGEPVVFRSDGVYLIKSNKTIVRLSDEPAPLAAAVRMSCSIPVVIASLSYKGQVLYDGALSKYGVCPVGLQIEHFNSDPSKIIACLVGDHQDPIYGGFEALCRGSWGPHRRVNWGAAAEQVISFRPRIDHVHTLKFSLSRDEKWLAILLSFEACVSRLAVEGILHGEQLQKVKSLLHDLGPRHQAQAARIGEKQWLSARAESCLAEYGLF